MGCRLFNHMCDEYPDLRESVKNDVIQAAKVMVDMELLFIDKVFEQGPLENLDPDDLKNFIKKRANEKLSEIGYSTLFEFDEESASKLDWFYHLSGGVTHTDFFAMRPTDYSKASEGENFEEVW
jgi:ribonucleoside-diphosphate reductase beta chain